MSSIVFCLFAFVIGVPVLHIIIRALAPPTPPVPPPAPVRVLDNITLTQIAEIKAVEAKVIENTDPIHILFEVENGELRQTLIKKHGGFEALLAKTQHDILHTDDYGVLFRVWVKALRRHFYYVKVINGTIEDDGSRREYYKEVPPDMDTAKEAVAWTYGLHPDDYHIAIRT